MSPLPQGAVRVTERAKRRGDLAPNTGARYLPAALSSDLQRGDPDEGPPWIRCLAGSRLRSPPPVAVKTPRSRTSIRARRPSCPRATRPARLRSPQRRSLRMRRTSCTTRTSSRTPATPLAKAATSATWSARCRSPTAWARRSTSTTTAVAGRPSSSCPPRAGAALAAPRCLSSRSSRRAAAAKASTSSSSGARRTTALAPTQTSATSCPTSGTDPARTFFDRAWSRTASARSRLVRTLRAPVAAIVDPFDMTYYWSSSANKASPRPGPRAALAD